MKKHLNIVLAAALLAVMGLSACSPAGPQAEPTLEQTLPAAAPQEIAPTALPAATEQTVDLPECELPLPGPDDWPVFLCDTFDGTHQTFPLESQDNPFAAYSTRISESQSYEVEYNAKAFAQFQRSAMTWFEIAEAQDFALSLKGTMTSPFSDVSWGIAFRGSEERDSFFLFSIMNNGTYAFEIYENNRWIPLISRRGFNGILPGGQNTIKVIAERRNFQFQINGQPVEGFDGGLLDDMQVFLLVSVKEGANATFTFDDLVMQI